VISEYLNRRPRMSVEDIWLVRTRLLPGTPYRCSVPRHLGMSIVMSRSIERSKNMRLRVTQDSVDMLYSLWTVLPRDGATQPGRIRQGCLTAKLRARHVSLDAARRHLTKAADRVQEFCTCNFIAACSRRIPQHESHGRTHHFSPSSSGPFLCGHSPGATIACQRPA
jgi:hypothetical protein